MDWLINFIPKNINLWLPIITSIISSYIGYRVTKSNTKNARKLEIKQNSFDKVYLPLYRKLINLTNYDISKSEALKIYVSIYVLVERNYIYVDPILIKLLREFKKLIDNDKYYADKLEKIHYNINNEYRNLRKYLSYPCMNLFRSFSSLDLKGQLYSIIFFIIMSILLSTYSLIFASEMNSTKLLTFFSYWFAISILALLFVSFVGGILIFFNFLSVKRKQKKKVHM